MRIIFIFCLLWLQGVAAQNVRVESLSPTPACPNSTLVYSCQVQFPSLTITWRHNTFGSLGFVAADEEVGSLTNSSDGRVVANLTMNEGTGLHNMVASTLTIQPPLNDLNGTDLNGTTLTCEGIIEVPNIRSGGDTIVLAGEPSPPDNLNEATPDDTPSVTIMWDPPVYTGGNGVSIQMYRIRIPEISYFKEETGTAHTITGGSINVMFNTPYQVEVTAINICEEESDSATITLSIEVSEPPLLTSLRATLQCSDRDTLKTDMHWEYGTVSSSVYTPPIEEVTVEVDGPAPISANECSDLTPSDMNCSFSIAEGGLYMVRLSTTNEIGTTPSIDTFDFAPISVDYSGLTSDDSPGITATLNPLCTEPLNNFFVGVLFGIRRMEETDCRFMQSRTVFFIDSRTVFVPLDTEVVTFPTDQAADYEYCAKVTLNDVICDVCRSEDDSNESGFSAGAASAIAVVLTLLLALPLGILIGCCGSQYRRRATEGDSGKPQQGVGAIYEEPGPVEAAIPLSENLAYGHVQGQRRN